MSEEVFLKLYKDQEKNRILKIINQIQILTYILDDRIEVVSKDQLIEKING